MTVAPFIDGTAPPWASGWGVDPFGRYAEFEYRGVLQRMRWMAPGRFWIGSRETEAGRGDDERRHLVTLTRGYWLAETACTQGLWEAVMGENPSRFKESPEQPVEQVSWEECQEFLRKLNGEVGGLEMRLPTEAEWEYACRAGTETAYWYGETVTPEQVNYDGKYPYAGGKKGLNRGETVPVKSLPANGWGLYEMHGNVWEWCSDWYGAYGDEAETDPTGAPEGVNRVFRGGSWFGFARGARSAQRDRIDPRDRSVGLGFRFARGP